MADRFKYSEVRQKIIDAIRTDLIGPREKEEILEENPRYAYLVGMLDIQSDDEDYSGAGEQEVDADMAFEDGEDFTAGEDDDNEPISTIHFQLPSSIGISVVFLLSRRASSRITLVRILRKISLSSMVPTWSYSQRNGNN